MNITARLSRFDAAKSLANYPFLQLNMKRHAEMVSHHKRQKHRPRRLDLLRYIQGHRKRNGRDTSIFNGALHERDALMADRSGRREQHNIRLFRLDRPSNILSQRPLQSLRIHIITDEGVEILGEPADKAFVDKFL